MSKEEMKSILIEFNKESSELQMSLERKAWDLSLSVSNKKELEAAINKDKEMMTRLVVETRKKFMVDKDTKDIPESLKRQIMFITNVTYLTDQEAAKELRKVKKTMENNYKNLEVS